MLSEPGAASPRFRAHRGKQAVRLAPWDLQRGDLLASRYQVEAVLGKGATGLVLSAFDRAVHVRVAIKIMRPEVADKRLWEVRIKRELRMARKINHPNVCRVHDVDEADGHWFLSMELADGGSLRPLLRPSAPARAWDERMADARAVVAGLAAIHVAGIIHRDLKPENVLRTGDGRLIVSDFSLAATSVQTLATIGVGTLSYMAPELAMDKPATTRSDVWSLGVVLHEILFGKRPESDLTAQGRVYESPVGGAAPPVERALARLCLDCMGDLPASRPADAPEVARRLEEALAARDLTPGERARAAVRRWAGTAAATGVIAALSLGSGLLALRMDSSRARPAAGAPSLAHTAAADMEKTRSGKIEPQGVGADVRQASRLLADVPGKIHCLSALPGGKALRMIWGEKKRVAEDLEIPSGRRSPAALAPQTFERGCPQLARDGRVLFESLDDRGRPQISLATRTDARDAQPLTLGSAPLWLPPREDEFVFEVGHGRAAIFSLNEMQQSILPDSFAQPKPLWSKAISPDGTALVLGFREAIDKSVFVGYQIESRSIVDSWAVGTQAEAVRAGLDADSFVASFRETSGHWSLAEVSTTQRLARRLWRAVDADVVEFAHLDQGDVFLLRRKSSDVWITGANGVERRVTTSGANWTPAVNDAGDVLVQTRNERGSFVIGLYPSGESNPIIFTTGPIDHSPSFLPDGRGWLFVKRSGEAGAIMRCEPHLKNCVELAVEKGFPVSPIASPDGNSVAFISSLGGSGGRLRVLAPDGVVRDLGTVSLHCPPRWSSAATISAVQGSNGRQYWVDINVEDGRVARKASHYLEPDMNCRSPLEPVNARALVRSVVAESSEVVYRERALQSASH